MMLNRDPDKRPQLVEVLRLPFLRPYVERAQDLPPGTPQLANPRSRLGVALLRTALRAAGTPPVRAAIGRVFSPPADEFALPDYPRLQQA